MDPLAHSLLGAALAKTRLGRDRPLALPTLVVAANVADVDVAAYFWSSDAALAFRRGLTHGPLGLAVLPALVAVAVWLLGRRWAGRPAALPSLLALAYLGAATHPALDWLNTYGVRFLYPFDRRWFYGDTLFIVDPWLWLVLGTGVVLGRRRGAATASVAALGLYVAASIGAAAAARGIVRDSIGEPVAKLMVGPLPLTVARREVVAEMAGAIRHGRFRWSPAPRFEWTGWAQPRPVPGAVLEAAMRDPSIQGFLGWVRFLFVEIDEHAEFWEVHLMDARYTLERGAPFGTAMVRVPRPR
jgi:inner membrane protein